MRIYISIQIYSYIQTYTNMYIYIHTYLCVCACACVCVCAGVRVRIYVCSFSKIQFSFPGGSEITWQTILLFHVDYILRALLSSRTHYHSIYFEYDLQMAAKLLGNNSPFSRGLCSVPCASVSSAFCAPFSPYCSRCAVCA